MGTFIMASHDVSTVQIAAAAGLDYAIFDLEHRPYGPETLHDLCQVTRLCGMAALVGPPEIDHHAICHALDLGASGVILPQVRQVDQVKLAIDAVRYPPQGKRGRCNVAGHNLYRPATTADELEHDNRNIALLLKVESEDAINNLEKLAAFNEVDGIQVGPSDLALDIGVPPDDRRIAELINHVRSVCKKLGKQFGDYVNSPDQLAEAIERGSTWTTVGSDIAALNEAWSKAAAANRQGQTT